MLLDIMQQGDTIWVSYYNLEGKTRFKEYKLESSDMFNWQVCDDTDPRQDSKIKNWDGRPVKKIRAKYLLY